jgi:hypothetical protein
MPHVRFAARDPGAADVLAVAVTSPRLAFPHDVWALPLAARAFGRAGIACREFAEPDPEVVRAAWREHPADALVTGTSLYEPFEPLLWELAASSGCPSLAVVDQWLNLGVRFRSGRPDFVGAIDEEQAGELTQLGIARERIVPVGHAGLVGLLDVPPRPRRGGGPVRVLFVSEPIAADVAAGANPPYGFDELDAFDLVEAGAAASGADVSLAVRFHPYEDPERFLRRWPNVEVRDEPADEAVAWADLVTGISSILLLRAVALGRPVVSVQPGLEREDTFVLSRRGLAPLATEHEAGVELVARLVADRGERERTLARSRTFLDGLPRDGAAPIVEWIEGALRVGGG